MQISEMLVTPIAITDPPLLNAAGLHAPYALRVIVELRSSSGLYGLGEVPGGSQLAEALNTVREVVVGKDPFHLNLIRQDIVSRLAHGNEERGDFPWDTRITQHVLSAVEVACFDLMGKATGRPVVDLLGGRCRDRVPFSAYLFYKYEGAGGELGFGRESECRLDGMQPGRMPRLTRRGLSRRQRRWSRRSASSRSS